MQINFAPFFDWASVIGVAMAVVWILRTRKKGQGALVMAFAFLTFASLAQSIKFDAPLWAILAISGMLLVLLLLDFVLRTAQRKGGQD